MPSAQRNSARRALLRLAGRSIPAARRPARLERALLVRPDHIGDVLLTAPAVALLAASLPGAHLSYLVGPWSAQAAQHGPPVDEVQTLAFPGFTRRPNANLGAPYVLLWHEARRLRQGRYDLAIVFRPDHWWGALLAQLAGIPVRVGGHTPETVPLLTHARAIKPEEHAAAQAMGMARLALRAFGVTPAEPGAPMTFRIGDGARQSAARIVPDNVRQQVVALHPSAGAPLKSWPVDRWASLADGLADLDLSIGLVGAPDDEALLARIGARMAQPPAFVARGQSLDVSAAIYQRCALVVALDSGAAHLAAAVGTPTVRLYGPASASVFGPWPASAHQKVLVTDRLACVPCGHLEGPPCGATTLPACMLALGVDDVLNAVRRQLRQD